MKLVLLHPLPLDGSIWSPSTRALGATCVAPTLYEHGDDLVGCARAVLDLVGGGPMTVVGCSVGGSCAIEITRLAPTDVRALVLSGTNPGHRPEPALRDEALQLLADGDVAGAWARYWAPLFGPRAERSVVERARTVAERCGAASIADGVRAFHGRSDRSAFLVAWPGPVWMVSGRHDIRPDRSRVLAPTLRHGTYREIDPAGHYVPIENPEAFDAVIREALESASRRPGDPGSGRRGQPGPKFSQ